MDTKFFFDILLNKNYTKISKNFKHSIKYKNSLSEIKIARRFSGILGNMYIVRLYTVLVSYYKKKAQHHVELRCRPFFMKVDNTPYFSSRLFKRLLDTILNYGNW